MHNCSIRTSAHRHCIHLIVTQRTQQPPCAALYNQSQPATTTETQRKYAMHQQNITKSCNNTQANLALAQMLECVCCLRTQLEPSLLSLHTRLYHALNTCSQALQQLCFLANFP
jgi:hypothetical protein